ncbi:uncharacterized protein [Medicago truncatula]|uniref:uncharacterized protein n=1 Tax=Medicago truncatula TaxID=3880 RepID=UPI000D2F208A|nr:uncharacterized protein LOC120575745 [Medicago truncatula]
MEQSVTIKRPITMEGGNNNITEEFVTMMEGGSCTANSKNVEEFATTMEDGSTTPTNKAEEIVMIMDGVSIPTTDNNNAEKFGMTVEDDTTSTTSSNNAEEFSMTMEGGSSTTPTNNNSEAFVVGCLLSIRTTFGEEFEAQVVTFDHSSNILGLMEGSKDAPLRKIRLLNTDYIQDFTFLGQHEDPLDPRNFYVDLNDLQAREELAIRQAEADAERIGVGVTSEAQNIFDALSKTLPVRWDKTVIVVMNEVRISSPYHPDCVNGGAPAANDRVKKVLEMLRKRLQLPCSGGQ